MTESLAIVASTLLSSRRTLEAMLPLAPRSAALRHLRAPVPLRFPEYAEMPEGNAHLIIRTFLYQLLRYALGPQHTVGSDQFVYWVPTNPRRCLSPDLFVKLGVPEAVFGSWKCWQRGAPELAVEVISPNEGDGIAWDDKLTRYAELGVEEMLRFDPEMPEGQRMRAWDRMDGDFVERDVSGDRTPCLTLNLEWVVRPIDALTVGLRLVDAEEKLVASQHEVATEGQRAAEARVRELEEELKRRR